MNSRFFCFVCFWDSTFKWDHSVDLLLISISLIKEQYPFKNRTAFITNQRANMIQWITTRVGIRSLDSQVCLQVTAHGLNTSMSFTDCSLKFPHLSEGGELFFICNLRGRISISCTSVQFIHSVVSNSLWPQGLQHARLPCPSPTPGACSNSCPSSRWCHPTISSSIVSFSSCLQSFPASGSFPMSQFFTSGGQSIGASISPSSECSELISFRIDWIDHLAVQGTLKSLLQHHSSKASILWHSAFFLYGPTLTSTYMTTAKTIALTRWTSVSKIMSLLFNMLSRLVIAFVPRSQCLLISWLQSPSAVILEPPK